jgi:flagellar hook assembly protein FlgD
LLNENLSTGSYEIKWNGTDNNGRDVSSGVYFYTLEQSDKKVTRKLILNR